MAAILEAKKLSKRYYDFTLHDMSLDIPAGCVFGVFGPTGAGKTTLMKLLARQIPASAGTVRVFGLGYEDREKEIKNRIGYVPQEPLFYQDRSVEFNARFAASFYERWDGGAFYRMLDEFKVGREKTVKRLSRGQKTLFSIALALSHGADLLILDEPTAGWTSSSAGRFSSACGRSRPGERGRSSSPPTSPTGSRTSPNTSIS